MFKSKTSGQAVVEYLFIFTIMLGLGFLLVRGVNDTVGLTFRSLAYQLTEKLSTGVCPEQCFIESFENGL